MKYARISPDGLVLETFVPPPGVTIDECFVPQIVAQFALVSDDVEAAWVKKEDGTFAAPETIVVPDEAPAP